MQDRDGFDLGSSFAEYKKVRDGQRSCEYKQKKKKIIIIGHNIFSE